MKTVIKAVLIISALAAAGPATAVVPPMQIEDMQLKLANDWHLKQDGLDQGKMILVFKKASGVVTLYVQQQQLGSLNDVFVNGSTMTMDPQRFNFNGHGWTVLETRKSSLTSDGTTYVFGFITVFEGNTYWGYAKAENSGDARDAGIEFLRSLQ